MSTDADRQGPRPTPDSIVWATCVAVARPGWHDCADVAAVLSCLTDSECSPAEASSKLSGLATTYPNDHDYVERREIDASEDRGHNARFEYRLAEGVRLDGGDR